MAKPTTRTTRTTRTSTTTAKAAEIYLEQVELDDHDSSVSEEGRAILAHIARMDLDRMLEAMGSRGEPFSALKHRAEKDLGITHTAPEYLGYSIQSIVESKLNKG